jgi:hypothetical protein
MITIAIGDPEKREIHPLLGEQSQNPSGYKWKWTYEFNESVKKLGNQPSKILKSLKAILNQQRIS